MEAVADLGGFSPISKRGHPEIQKGLQRVDRNKGPAMQGRHQCEAQLCA
jgi:hypothetical protein